MASMGFRSFEEMIGRADKLRMRKAIEHWKARGVDLSAILHRVEAPEGEAISHSESQHHDLEKALDNELIERCLPALEKGEQIRFSHPIFNTNRTVGGMLSGEIARRHGSGGLPDGTIRIDLKGVAGQSFGAWAAKGLTLTLEGTTNDYVGKGLSGGRLAVFPSKVAAYEPEKSIVVGNVALYGATAGEAYFRGFAGERFAVRNSGAHTVVEGVGDHGCEYMTGGVVVVLGPTGRNFAAGMSGGVAFILDEEEAFEKLCNRDMVGLEAVESEEDFALLRGMIERHLEWTSSTVAERVLDNFEDVLPKFVKVMPVDLKRVLEERQEAELEAVG
jgi:glutamate synthase (NADPH) large chain